MCAPTSQNEMTSPEKSKRRGGVRLFAFLILAIVASAMIVNKFAVSGVNLDPAASHTTSKDSASRNRRSTGEAASGAAVLATGNKLEWVSDIAKPVIIELGVVVLFQTVGLPFHFLSKVAYSMRRMPRVSAVLRRSLRLSAPMVRSLKAGMRKGVRLWNFMKVGYKKTSATKVVGHSKKIAKIFIHHHDDEEEE